MFSDGTAIEDDMAVMVRYRNGATMSYHLTAYSPWKGYRVSVGTSISSSAEEELPWG